MHGKLVLLSNAQIAQLVEQGTENPCVAGSIPALGTIPDFYFIFTINVVLIIVSCQFH
jgi:hypothetical protein